MNKDQQNPHFEIWLAAYERRLIEVAESCLGRDEVASPVLNPEEEISGKPNDEQSK